ncbi:class A beta-lactamase [uncultured Phenylobacterium sp.]|uniref:class A beta-lactamase n=1 Tax=uncultured Phenylobacterium sp. TaxID=349273 RepID=UPI0025F57EC8|nr:class A beta-lactamase [uncultured Phenylobacterium sp.]
MATLSRRSLLSAAPAGLLAGCDQKMPTTVSTTPAVALPGLDKAIVRIADAVRPGALGVGLMNLESGQSYVHNGERRFPMQSVFKMLLGAAVLAEVDAGRVLMSEGFYLLESQLSPPWSPIAQAWPGRREYTADQLLEAAVSDSDNTAADVLMKRIGGPGALTAWLTAKRVKDIRVDRYERELSAEVYGMPSFRPAWRTEAAFAAARDAVPPATRAAAARAYLADPRDTATPAGMLAFLQMLDRGDLISQASTRRLVALMSRTRRGAGRLKAGLPKSAFLAHRPGTSGFDLGLSSAHNDVGIFTLADKRSYAICAFLSGSTLDEAARDAIIAQVAAAAVRAVG